MASAHQPAEQAQPSGQHETRTNLRGVLAVFTGACVIGFSAIFAKWAMAGGATPVSVGFYRMGLALPVAFALARRSGGMGSRQGQTWALLAGGAFFVDLVLWHLSMKYTTAANATLLVAGLAPIWVALFSLAVLHLRYRWFGWVGQGIGVGGALILAIARGARSGSGKGEAIAMVASLCYATFALCMSRARRHLNTEQSLFWMSLGSFVGFAIAALATGQPMRGYSSLAWASLVGLALVVQLVAWWMSTWGLGHVNAALGAIALQGQQVATMFLAAWLLQEAIKPLGLLGAGLIIVGILLVAWARPSGRAARPETHPVVVPGPTVD